MEASVKRWQRVASLAEQVRLVEARIECAEAAGREPSIILVRLAQTLHAQLQRERLSWEGVAQTR
jgi:hypothetical protein